MNAQLNIGIDQIGLYVPHQYVDLEDLARARGVEPAKFTIGIGQSKMSVPSCGDDIVSMGANAIADIIADIDMSRLGMLIVGTESGVDQSKSSSLFIKHLVGLPKQIESFEIKEACFAGTAGLFAAHHYVAAHPDKTVLVVASDVARYGLGTAGEVTQGAGAIAMLISADPRIVSINDDAEDYSDDINDFWRPNGLTEALVDGKYSTQVYLDFFRHVFDAYCDKHSMTIDDFSALIFHLPFTKMGVKALNIALEHADEATCERLRDNCELGARYSRNVGNVYTGSLYLSLMSWLEHNDGANGQRIGLFSYGSGAMGKFFTGVVQPGYHEHLHARAHQNMLNQRERITVDEYEHAFTDYYSDSGQHQIQQQGTGFHFDGVRDSIRRYSQTQ